MSTIISADAVKNSGLSFDNVKSYASATGLLAAGFVVAHAGLKLLKQDNNWMVSAGLTAVSFAVAMYVPNPYVKLALLGVAVYGGLKTVAIGVREVTAPANTGAGGLSGFIPETLKAQIRNYIPSLGSLGDYDSSNAYVEDQGYAGELDDDVPYSGMDEAKELAGSEEELSGVAGALA
jgi:hypothetical protein